MSQEGNPVRVGSGGLAFAVGLDGSPAPAEISLDSSVVRVHDSGEPTLTAEQINEKLAAAEARRQVALEEVRLRGAEEANKVEKASEARLQYQEEVKEALDAKLENAQAHQDAHRQALLERLRQGEIHHEQVLSQRGLALHSKLQDLHARYTKEEGKRHEVLEEIVEKVKHHNDHVKLIHDELMAEHQQEHAAAKKQQYLEASNQREEYLNSAEARLASKELHPYISKYM